MAESTFDPYALVLVDFFNAKALIAILRRDPKTAAAAGRRVVSIAERHPEQHLLLATALMELAESLNDSREFGEAAQSARRALAIQEAEAQPDLRAIRMLNFDLGVSLYYSKSSVDASSAFQRAIKLLKLHPATVPPNDDIQADSLYYLGRLADDTAAEKYYRESLAIDDTMHDGRPRTFRDCLLALSSLLETRQDWKDAEALIRRELEETQQYYPDDRRLAAQLLTAMGTMSLNKWEYQDAEQFYRRALTLTTQAYGNQSDEAATAASNLGLSLVRLGKLDEAKPFLDTFLAFAENSTSQSVLSRADLLKAELYGATSDYKQALGFIDKALEREGGENGANSGVVGGYLLKRGRLLMANGELEEAAAVLVQADVTLSKARQSTKFVDAEYSLGELAEQKKDCPTAKGYYENARQAAVRLFGNESAIAIQVRSRLSRDACVAR